MSQHWVPAKTTLEAGVDGLRLEDVGTDSKIIAAKLHMPHKDVMPLVTPVFHAATYTVKSVDHYLDILQNGGYIYSRFGNPSCEEAECAVNALEGGAGSVTFPSGMAAITSALTCFLKAGDHMISCNPVYSGTHKYLKRYLGKFNIEVTFVKSGAPVDVYRQALKPNTRVLYGETPCNPLNSILDLEEFGKLGQSLPDVMTMVDSTYASPYLQQPIKYGIDIAIHSSTKYLGGHSDICTGVATTRTLEQWKKLNTYKITIGSIMSPHDAYTLCRGMKTLHVRMERHCTNAQKCAEFLEQHPKIKTVHYSGLPSDPGYELAKKQMKGCSGMLSFEMKGGIESAKTVVQSVKLIQCAISLGGVQSLMQHPACMTHGPMVMTDEDRKEAWISDGLIRLSVGLEGPDDLIKDLQQALDLAQ